MGALPFITAAKLSESRTEKAAEVLAGAESPLVIAGASGADVETVPLLVDLAAYLKSAVLASDQPTIAGVYVVGHSNGGMMANRVWCEDPTTFDAYVSLAGPAAQVLASCVPDDVRPYFGLLGEVDTVLCAGANASSIDVSLADSAQCTEGDTNNGVWSNWDDQTYPLWRINDQYAGEPEDSDPSFPGEIPAAGTRVEPTCNGNVEEKAFTNPCVVNEIVQQRWRVQQLCPGAGSVINVNSYVVVGGNKVWAACPDAQGHSRLKLEVVPNANHPISDGTFFCKRDSSQSSPADYCSLQVASGAVAQHPNDPETALMDEVMAFINTVPPFAPAP